MFPETSRFTVLVTGASRGIGAGVARAYAARGAHLLLNARDEAALARVTAGLRGAGAAGIDVIAGDIAIPDTRAALVEAARRHGGRVDVLVNNAGHFLSKPFLRYSLDELRGLFAVHLETAFALSQAVVPLMAARRQGAIVNVTTVLARRGLRGVPAAAPAAIKGGIEALTRSLAHELARDGIRVNAVAPGTIRTAIHGLDDAALDRLGPMQPLGRIGEVDEIVQAIVHLADAPFTTGVVLDVDGGVLAGSP